MRDYKDIFEDKNSDNFIIVSELFNFIIPPSQDKKLPGASFLLNEKLLSNSILIDLIDKALVVLLEEIQLKDFSTLSDNDRFEKFNKFKLKSNKIYNELSFEVLKLYYTNKLVLLAIGKASVPPFPEGNSVKEGDLYLLEQVFLKGEIYRK